MLESNGPGDSLNPSEVAKEIHDLLHNECVNELYVQQHVVLVVETISCTVSNPAFGENITLSDLPADLQ